MMDEEERLRAELGVALSDDDDDDSLESEDRMEDEHEAAQHHAARRMELERILREEAPHGPPHAFYATRIELIQLLRQEAAVEELAEQREELARLHALPAAEWRRWLSDENQILFMYAHEDAEHSPTVSTDAIQRILDLFERALSDFLSIELWLDYVSFLQMLVYREAPASPDAMQVDGADNQLAWDAIRDAASSLVNEQMIREKFEAALRVCAFHIRDSHLLWTAFREFEQRVDRMTPNKEILVEKIRKLYRRQLGSPSLHADSIFAEYLKFEASATGKQDVTCPFQDAYQRAQEALKERLNFEKTIEENESDPTKLATWWEYIKFEVHQKKPHIPRSICLFERAISAFPTVVQFWEAFTDFLFTQGGVNYKATLVDTAARATRNCPFSSRSWISQLLALHRSGRPRPELDLCLDKALKAPMTSAREFLDVYQTYFDIRSDLLPQQPSESDIKTMRDLFDSTVEYFGSWGPELCWELRKSEALFEERKTKDINAARVCWESAIKSEGAKKNAAVWLEFVRFEERHGETSRARSILKQALNAACDVPEFIQHAWYDLERLGGGSTEEYNLALHRIGQQRLDTGMQQLLSQYSQSSASLETDGQTYASKTQKKPKKKRAADSEPDIAAERSAKRTRTDDNIDLSKAKRRAASTQQDPLVVHVSGMTSEALAALDAEKLQSTFETIFKEYGAVRSVRTVENSRRNIEQGAPPLKPFIYIEFASSEAANKAVNAASKPVWLVTAPQPAQFVLSVAFASKLRPTAAGRAIMQHRSGNAPEKKYSDKNTLFLSNLPFRFSDKDVQRLVETVPGAPTPIGVRLMKDRENPNRSRGIAYIEYKDEADVESVAKALHGTLHDGRVIKAERSKPPARSGNPPPPPSFVPASDASSPAATDAPAPSAPAKKPFAMPIPRSVRVNNPKKKIDVSAPKE